jgi:hypothetical protein
VDESIDSTLPHQTVKMVAKKPPPPIQGPPGTFKDSDDEEDTVESLRVELTMLKNKLNNREEHCAEGELWRMDIDDKISVLRKGLCTKVRRLVEASEHPNLYNPPTP